MRLFWILIAIVSVGMILLMVTGADGTTLGVDSDNFATALWLVPILLLVSAGILQSRRDLGCTGPTARPAPLVPLGLANGVGR